MSKKSRKRRQSQHRGLSCLVLRTSHASSCRGCYENTIVKRGALGFIEPWLEAFLEFTPKLLVWWDESQSRQWKER
jgi:hypothetical protein